MSKIESYTWVLGPCAKGKNILTSKRVVKVKDFTGFLGCVEKPKSSWLLEAFGKSLAWTMVRHVL